MKKSLLLIVVAIIALTTSINASAQWTDLNTFGLKGPVKEVYKNGNDYASLKFNKDGKYQTPSEIKRDEYSRIIEIGKLSDGGFETYTYNNKGQVIEYIHHDFYWLDFRTDITKFTYNSKGQISKEILTEINSSLVNNTYTYTYTYQAFDKYGNWTKRTRKAKYGSKIETRTITYYE